MSVSHDRSRKDHLSNLSTHMSVSNMKLLVKTVTNLNNGLPTYAIIDAMVSFLGCRLLLAARFSST